MHKLISILILATFFSSCDTYKTIPLSTTFKPDPIAIVKISGLSKDQAWDRAVRLFADRNVSIKTIDKSSGFIQSDVVSFVSAYQIDGQPTPSNPVYIVTQCNTLDGMIIQPSYLTGYLRIFILSDSSQTEIRVNIEDLRNTRRDYRYANTSYGVVSTGRLESEIAVYISSGRDSANIIQIQNGEALNPHFPRMY